MSSCAGPVPTLTAPSRTPSVLASPSSMLWRSPTERCSQLALGAATPLSGQIERESGGWWATLDSNQ